MSKLGERLRNVSRRRPATLGFATRTVERSSSRQVLVIAEADSPEAASNAVAAGADALLYVGHTGGLADVAAAAGGLPLGVGFRVDRRDEVAALAGAGADFLVFDDSTTDADALIETQLGYIARASDIEDTASLRLLRPLELDAVMVEGISHSMTVRDQTRLRRVAEAVRKPLFVRMGSAASALTLQVWRDAGVLAVIAPAGDPAALTALLEAAGAVPPPRESKDRPDALLPSRRPGAEADDEEDDGF